MSKYLQYRSSQRSPEKPTKFIKGYEREVKLNMDDVSEAHNQSISGTILQSLICKSLNRIP